MRRNYYLMQKTISIMSVLQSINAQKPQTTLRVLYMPHKQFPFKLCGSGIKKCLTDLTTHRATNFGTILPNPTQLIAFQELFTRTTTLWQISHENVRVRHSKNLSHKKKSSFGDFFQHKHWIIPNTSNFLFQKCRKPVTDSTFSVLDGKPLCGKCA